MAKKELEEFLDEEDVAKEYDEEAAREEGEQASAEAKNSGKLEPAVDLPENTARTARARTVVDFTQDDEIPVPQTPKNVEMILVAEFGGRFQTWHFDNLQVIQGFAQNLKGKKRLFQKVEGQSELQEINALGDIVKR